jgi:uncharacterized protein (TIGR02217 family)
MSSFVYPGPSVLPGLSWNRERSYLWATEIQEAVSGKETRLQYRQYPRVRFQLKYELLRDNLTPSEAKRLVGLFNALAGSFDTCLFLDPDFSSVTAESFGTGDGTTTAFQLVARYQVSGGPGTPEIIQNLNGAPSIYDDGGLVSGGSYTLGATGIVTFNTPPVSGHALTWTGAFHYRVRFMDDDLPLTQFMQSWWQSREVQLISVKL